MSHSFRGFLIPRIAALIIFVVAAAAALTYYRTHLFGADVSVTTLLVVLLSCGFLFMGAFLLIALDKTLLNPMRDFAQYVEKAAESGGRESYGGDVRFELGVLEAAVSVMIGKMDSRAEQAQEKARQAVEKSREADTALKKVRENEENVSNMLESMQQASVKAEEISSQVLASVRDLSAEVDQVGNGVHIQQERMAAIATAMEEMNATVGEVARNASHAAVNASESSDRASTGSSGVQRAVSSIGEIETQILSLKDTMGQLGDKASSIGEVLNVITDIADQTNLLALNAAIEAARAGEAGRGFAVVADEVRKLAEKTMSATKEVETVIVSIQQAARDNVAAVEATAEGIAESTEASREARQFMDEIVAIVGETSGQVDSIATAAEEQSATSEEINRAVTDMNEIAAGTAQGMRSSADNLASITALISELDATVQAMTSVETIASYDANADLVSWSDKLSVGIPSIDAQHKKLVSMINGLNRAMREKRSQSAMLSIVRGLGEYVVTHFGYEEKLFAKHGYPDIDAHKEVHRNFVAKVQEFESALSSGKATVSMDVLQFLKDWLVEHIMGTDKQYSEFLVEKGEI